MSSQVTPMSLCPRVKEGLIKMALTESDKTSIPDLSFIGCNSARCGRLQSSLF
jgi:hypothetical protein